MFGARNDVPLDRDASSRFLPWLIAVMVYLATMSLVVAITMNKLADRWNQGLSNSLTIQVPTGQTLADRQAIEKKLQNLQSELIQLDNVETVEILNDSELNRLLEPWLGKDVLLQDLPIPFLVSIELEQPRVKTIDAINTIIAQNFPEASVDDHQRWLGNLLGLAKVIQMVSLLVVLLVGSAAGLMVILVTRMGLAIHKQVVELFHHMGAHDSYIATRFQIHALKLSTAGEIQEDFLAYGKML